MTKLSDTQTIILNGAAQRPGNVALPLPTSLRGGAAKKVVDALIAKGFLDEVDADMRKGEPVWRETGDGHGTTLVATNDGLLAIGIEPEGADAATDGAQDGATGAGNAPAAGKGRARKKAAQRTPSATDGAKATTTRSGTKQAALIAMLRRPEGASIGEISEAFGWQQHTTRGAIAGALKRKLGLDVQSERVDGRGTVYRLPAEG